MKNIRLPVAMSVFVCFSVLLIANLESDSPIQRSVSAFEGKNYFVASNHQHECQNCFHNIGLQVGDSTSAGDSTAIIQEQFNAIVETMLDDNGTISHGIDPSISPCEDHFEFVNGGWRKSVTMPKSPDLGHQMMSFFTYSDIKILKRMQQLLDSARTLYSSTSDPTLKVLGTFYESCMTVDTLEYAVLKKVRLERQKIDSTRSQECVSRTMEHLGGAAGQVFAEDLRKSGAVQRMNVLTAALKEAVIDRLKANTIMSADEKTNALDRLKRLVFRIGIPDSLVDYSELKLSPTDYRGNKVTIGMFRQKRWIGMIGQDLREKWKMSLLRSNASYLPGDHAIEIPAIMFYPPFFFKDGEDLQNFSSVGYIIGHEVFHSVAPQLAAIENPAMKEEIDSFRNFVTSIGEFDGWKPDGMRTFGEDVADLGGSRIAYTAWRQTVKKDRKYKDKTVGGFTPDQRFFISMARVWRSKWTPAGRSFGPHGPNFARVNAVAMQTPEFRRAFGCKPGDKMYLSDDKLSRIW